MSAVKLSDRDDDRGLGGNCRTLSRKEIEHFMDWSDKQRRILTDNGKAELWYCPERGYSFTDDELPHYYLQSDHPQQQQAATTREVFHQWKVQQRQLLQPPTNYVANPIAGIWERTLFYGGFEYTTNHSEYTYNIQTTTLFIDLRIPKTRDEILMIGNAKLIQSLYDLNTEQLRYYARQHIFAGYTKVQCVNTSTDRTAFPYCATRYHCIDWNYVGIPRSRPNKWYIELPANHNTYIDDNDDNDHLPQVTTATEIPHWKEWAYATNQHRQHYYCEHWQRHNENEHNKFDSNKNMDQDNLFLILRKCSDPDGIIILWNDHIMYCLDRDPMPSAPSSLSSIVAVVDDLLLRHRDIEGARRYLSMQGGHGRWRPSTDTSTNHDTNSSDHNDIHGNRGSWIMDHCIEFWKQGQPFFGTDDLLTVTGTSIEHGTIQWTRPSSHSGVGTPNEPETSWSIFDTNIDSIDSIRSLLWYGPKGVRRPAAATKHGRDPKL